jgi:hypothetical protein
MKQKKIQSEDMPQTEEQAIIAQIIDTCVFAKEKDDLEIMLSALRAELRGRPYNINARAITKLAAMIGKTEAVTKRKVKALCANGYMQIDPEQYLYIVPLQRTNKTEAQLAEVLLKYQEYLLEPVTKRQRTKTASQLLSDICPHRGKARNESVCALLRYPECVKCKWGSEQE